TPGDPNCDCSEIALDNPAEPGPGTGAMSIAGIVEPRLVPQHFWPAAPSSAKPPEAIDRLLRDVAAGSASARLAPGLAAFISPDMRERRATAQRRHGLDVRGLRRRRRSRYVPPRDPDYAHLLRQRTRPRTKLTRDRALRSRLARRGDRVLLILTMGGCYGAWREACSGYRNSAR